MQFEKLPAWSRAVGVAHSDRPNPARDPRQGDVFGVEPTIEKERKARSKLIDRNPAPGEHFRVSEPIRKCVSGLLNRRGAGFADVITANRDRIPARQFARGEFDHVGEKTQRRFDWKNRFVLGLDFLENVGLNRTA